MLVEPRGSLKAFWMSRRVSLFGAAAGEADLAFGRPKRALFFALFGVCPGLALSGSVLSGLDRAVVFFRDVDLVVAKPSVVGTIKAMTTLSKNGRARVMLGPYQCLVGEWRK